MAQRKIAFVEGSAPNSSALKGAIQLGIAHSEESLSQKPDRDILMQDFEREEGMFFPSEGSNLTPAHCYSDFTFKTFAPIAFRYFRDVFGVRSDDYRASLCSDDMSLIEQSSSEAGGSTLFYVSSDDKFVIKTVQHREVSVLQRLLPGYYMNLNQNKRTLLPRLYGLYCVQAGGKTIHTVVMNNLLPCDVQMHLRYYLKGSTYKRRALAKETDLEVPTYKDLDFLDMPSLLLDNDKYKAISETIQKDCKVLQNFDIMNYRLLVGVHNVDRACREGQAMEGSVEQRRPQGQKSLYATGLESIQGEASLYADDHAAGIPARDAKGERLLLFIGITDILQSYTLGKKLEYTWKSLVYGGDSVSVHRPSFYAERFQRFMCNTVFINLSLKVPLFKKVPKKREAPPTPTPTLTPSPSAPPPSPPYPALIPPSCCPTLKDVQMHLHHLQLHLHHLVGGDENSSSFQGVTSFSSADPCTET